VHEIVKTSQLRGGHEGRSVVFNAFWTLVVIMLLNTKLFLTAT